MKNKKQPKKPIPTTISAQSYIDSQGRIHYHTPGPSKPLPPDFVQWLQFVESLARTPTPNALGFEHIGYSLKTDYGMYLVDTFKVDRSCFAHHWSIEPKYARVFDSFIKARFHVERKFLADVSICEVRYSKHEDKYLMPVILHVGHENDNMQA